MSRRGSARWAIPCSLLILGGCAATSPPPEPTRITLPAQRISQLGYSLVPPNEDGWAISQRDRLLLALGKHGAHRNEVLVIHGAPFQLAAFQSDDDFVRLVRARQEKDTDPLRFKVVKHDVTSYPGKGTTCAHSHQILEDHEALTDAGSRVYMVREMLSLTCAHPQRRDVGINVTYSHRYHTGQRDPRLIERATGVLKSVEFSALRF